MKLSDFVASFLSKYGVKHVFAISGGASAHLIDSIAKCDGIEYICPQHEEHGAMAADGYARVSRNLGVAISTSGPGATNMLTGVCGSYFDSVPTIIITGQVASFRLKKNERLRQVGFQETNVVEIYKSVTKYAKQLKNPQDIQYILQEAIYHAKHARPGPVLIDIPDDLQRAEINPQTLSQFIEPDEKELDTDYLQNMSEHLFNLIKDAKKPIFVLGAGVKISGYEKDMVALVERFNIPVLLTWGAKDLLEYEHPLNVGGFGIVGPRYGNFTVQNADLVIGIGTRFSQMLTGANSANFAPNAKKVMIDIDAEEILKFEQSELYIDLPIVSDVKEFIKFLQNLDIQKGEYKEWMSSIEFYKSSYPICPLSLYAHRGQVNAYVFVDALSNASKKGDIIVGDTGGNLSWLMQTFKFKEEQIAFSSWNHSPMGYALAGAVGASFADPSKDVIAVIGDGGLQMCIEELATISRHNLSIKIFLFNNQGQGIMRQTIDTWLDSNYNAIDYETGLLFPDFSRVAEAYGLKTAEIHSHENIEQQISDVLNIKGAVFCNVFINKYQQIKPQLVFGKGLDDMWPYIQEKK